MTDEMMKEAMDMAGELMCSLIPDATFVILLGQAGSNKGHFCSNMPHEDMLAVMKEAVEEIPTNEEDLED